MPKKPKNEAVTPDSEVKNADGDKVVRPVVTAEADSNAEFRVRLFKEAAQAVHVTPMEKGWQVYRVGTEPKEFGEISLAIEFAEHDAKKYKVPALLHELGHAIKLTD